MKLKLSLLMLMTLIGIGESFGQYSITGTGSGNTYTQNFDAFRGTAATLPSNWAVNTPSYNATYPVITSGATTPNVSQASGNSCYAGRASSSSSDYSIVQKQATSGSTTFTFSTTNNTGSTINGFEITWNVEQYASAGRATTVDFSYRLGTGSYVTTGITGTNLFTATTGSSTTFSVVQTARSISISGITLAAGSTADFRFTIANGGGSSNNAHIGIDDFTIYATTATVGPEINIKQGTTNITSAGTYGFGNQVSGTASSAVSFTIENTGSTDLTLSGSPKIAISGTDASTFIVNETATTSPISAIGSTTFAVTFIPTSQGLKSAILTIANDDSDEGSYVVNLTGTGTVSTASDIITKSGYTYLQNIDYANYQSTNITNSATDVEIAKFTIRDGGTTTDADNLGTTLSQIVFSLSNSSNIRKIALYDGTTEIGTEQAGASSVTFSGLALSASDGGTKDFSVRATFNATVIDNQQIGLTVSSATTVATGSGFANANAGSATTSIAGDDNKIEVTASKLVFMAQPPASVNQDATMSAVTISASDVNNNRDLDYTAPVSLSSTGIMTGSPISISASSGLATFSSIVHTVAGTGLFLSASSGGLVATGNSNSFNVLALVPEINLQGNSTTIADGNNTPSTTNHTDFGNVVWGNSFTRTFTIQNTGTGSLSLSGSSPYITISGSNLSDFAITSIPSNAINAGGSTTFAITFTPSGTGVRTATVTINNTDNDEGIYDFVIQGTGMASASSDIIANPTYSYNSNIAYNSYQTSTISSTANSIDLFKFDIRDGAIGADADNLPTILNAITFNLTNTSMIRSAALFNGNGLVNASPVINTVAGTIAFSGLSGTEVTASDGGVNSLMLRVTFLATVTDNTQFQVTIASANTVATTGVTSSQFGTFTSVVSSTTGDRNRIEVQADRLAFVQNVSNVATGATMSPSPTVSANDINGNRDLDFVNSVSLASTGLPNAQSAATAIAGLATFNAVTHSAEGTGLQLTASFTGLSNAISNLFNVSTVAFVSGDYRTNPLFTGVVNFNSTSASGGIRPWQKWNGSSWVDVTGTSATEAPQSLAIKPENIYVISGSSVDFSGGATYNNIFIEFPSEITFISSSNTTTGLTIASGKKLDLISGSFIIDGRFEMLGTSQFIVRESSSLYLSGTSFNRSNSSVFEVENNAYIEIDANWTNHSTTGIWNGTEIFHENSIFHILDWNDNEKLFASTATISPTIVSGYSALFGQLTIEIADGDLAGNWTVLPANVSLNLTHGNLEFITDEADNVNFYSGNTSTIGVGGDFIASGTGKVQFQTGAGAFTFNIKRDFIKNGILNCNLHTFSTSTLGNDVILNIGGNLVVNAGTLALNTSNSSGTKTIINLKGNFIKLLAGKMIQSNTVGYLNSSINFVGSGIIQTVDLEVNSSADMLRHLFYVKNGAYVKLIDQNWQLATDSKITVESGATLDFGFLGTTALGLIETTSSATTSFILNSGGTIKITSPDGIASSGLTGNVQLDTRTYDNTGIYHYIGKANQVTGTGLPVASHGKFVICELDDNTLKLTPSQSFAISNGTTLDANGGKLDIRKGIVVETPVATITGSGRLVMTDGVFRSNVTGVTLPALTNYALYSLTGGTVELNSTSGSQTISGTPSSYYNVTFSGANTLGTDDKNPSSPITINNQLYITGSAIFNSADKGVTGTANVIMDGGRWRISKLTNIQPELSGSYTLTNGTVELYGTTASTSHVFRGGITYANIDVNASVANSNYSGEFYNVSPASSIVLNGNLNVYSPAVFRLDVAESIAGAGNIYINSGSTLLYGAANGIKTTGTSTTDGAIRISGTRSFSGTASYGFIGNNDMTTGNGIPASVENLYVVKGNATDNVTLTNPSLTAKNTLYFIKGNIVTASNELVLGESTSNKGILNYTSGFVKGTMKRWFNGTNSGNTTGLFPLGTTANENRFAKIEFTNAPTVGGVLTASLTDSAMGTAGISLLPSITSVGLCSAFNVVNTDNLYWTLIPQTTALQDGNYTATFTKENTTATIPICDLTILKREATDWIVQGTHLEPTGTSGMVVLSRSGLSDFSDFGFGNRSCLSTKVWNSGWTGGDGNLPTISDAVIFDSNYDTLLDGGSVKACSCKISSGITVSVANGDNFEVMNELVNNGNLEIKNNGSFVQYSDEASNAFSVAATFTMERFTQPMYRYDYTYWSSPVALDSGFTLHDLSPLTLYDKYLMWNSSTQAWNTSLNGTQVMFPGKGYAVRAPQTYSTNPALTIIYEDALFAGKPNNGEILVPIVGGLNKWNLIGNPYPSAINIDLFLSNSVNDDIVDGTIYLWTHNSPPSDAVSGSNTYNYTADDYATYNFTGATGTGDNANSESNTTDNTPTGFIASGQAFFIKGLTSGDALFNNGMRVAENNSQFFRSANSNTAQSVIEKHRIWLNVTNAQGAFNQALVGYIQGATNGVDRGFDGETFGGNFVSLYSIEAQKNLTIQGRALPFSESDEVDLGFKATISGAFKISLDHFDGLFANQNIYLEDKSLNIIHDLKQSPYDFTSAIGTFNSRFVLRYTTESLSNPDFETNQNSVIITQNGSQIKVISSQENIQKIEIYDILGRQVFSKDAISEKEFTIPKDALNLQVLILKIVLENRFVINRKMVLD